MAYAPNYYNYQVAVIFAIMLGGMLLLALVVGAIYFICVVHMRNKKGMARSPSGVGRGGVAWQPPIQTQIQPPYSSLHNQPISHQNPSIGEYDPRQPTQQQPSPYTGAYNNQPLVQQYQPQQQYEGARIRELQPEYAYQQGPVTWTTMSPVREDHIGRVGSPTTGYHMSSV